MEEVWKQVVLNDREYPFDVSNLGDIRYHISHEPLRVYEYRGYLMINSLGESLRLHRLVAHMFVPNDDPVTKKQVHHKNHNPLDNRAENLEWISASEHGKESSGLRKKVMSYEGDLNPNVKYPKYKIIKICELLQEGKLSCPEIAKLLDIPLSTVQNILLGQNWKSVSKDYDFSLHKKVVRHSLEILKYVDDRILKGDDFETVVYDTAEKFNIPYEEANDVATRIRYKYRKKGLIETLPSRSLKYPDATIHKVCKMLEKGYNLKTISEILNVGVGQVSAIKHGRVRTDISSQYNINTDRLVKDHSKFFDIAEKYVLSGKRSRDLYEDVLKDEGYTRDQAKALFYSRYDALKRRGKI